MRMRVRVREDDGTWGWGWWQQQQCCCTRVTMSLLLHCCITMVVSSLGTQGWEGEGPGIELGGGSGKQKEQVIATTHHMGQYLTEGTGQGMGANMPYPYPYHTIPWPKTCGRYAIPVQFPMPDHKSFSSPVVPGAFTHSSPQLVWPVKWSPSPDNWSSFLTPLLFSLKDSISNLPDSPPSPSLSYLFDPSLSFC